MDQQQQHNQNPEIVDLGGDDSSRSASPLSDDIDIIENEEDGGGVGSAMQTTTTTTATAAPRERERRSGSGDALDRVTSPKAREGPYTRGSASAAAAGSSTTGSKAGRAVRGATSDRQKRGGAGGNGSKTTRRQATGGSTGGGGGGGGGVIGMEDFEDFNGNAAAAGGGGGLESAQGQKNAFDRLLDLDYPRDFGDPFARYDAAMREAASTSGGKPTGRSKAPPPPQPTSQDISPTTSTAATFPSHPHGPAEAHPTADGSAPPQVVKDSGSGDALPAGEESMNLDA